jgi:hypothetical protein
MADKMNEQSETGCCPRFNPEPWQEKEVVFKDRLFVKDNVRTIFHIPFGFGRVMLRNIRRITEAHAVTDDPLLLYRERSLWKAEVYIAVAKDVPKAKMEEISGTFLTKVFEGSFGNAGKWVKEMNKYVKSKGKEPKKIYLYFTYCPKCAKAYGKNYTVLLAEV